MVFALAVVVWQRAEMTNLRLAIIYFTTALPFFVSGAIVSLAISEGMERVDRVYFFDLLGAAGGCLLLVPLLEGVGGPNTTIVTALLFAAAAAIWHNMAGSFGGRVISVALGLALVVGLIVVNGKYRIIDVHYAKGQELTGEFFVKWNSFSRIAVAPEKDSGMLTIFIDADASTGIANFDFEHLTERERRDLLYQGPGLPYMVRPGAKTLIIGPGGGWDVARAIASGSHDITGVEINPIIANTIMREKFPRSTAAGSISGPEVHIFIEDGRSFVRRSPDKFQVMQATLVDTWASTAAGAFALSENNLYTTDAFYDYLSHLTPDGFLAFTRWGFDPPRESLRLISLGMAALGQLGETDPRKPFHRGARRVHRRLGRQGHGADFAQAVHAGVHRPPRRHHRPRRHADRVSARRVDSQPVHGTDACGRPGSLLSQLPIRHLAGERQPPVLLLHRAAARPVGVRHRRQPRRGLQDQSRRAAAVRPDGGERARHADRARAAPLVLGTRLPRRSGVLRFLWYFVCIGAGYILIQVALIQKFVLFLGHPTYALTVVIFSMLVSSGLGSFWSRRLVGESEAKLVFRAGSRGGPGGHDRGCGIAAAARGRSARWR